MDGLRELRLSCLSCRKTTRNEINELYCKERGTFIVMSEDKPCIEWLPSKKDIRKILKGRN